MKEALKAAAEGLNSCRMSGGYFAFASEW
jgi:hypothetical protein